MNQPIKMNQGVLDQSLGSLQEKMKKNPLYKKFFITTFGCQMNARDSEKLHGIMESIGLLRAETEETADIVLYNTCCVRENAENRVYGHLGYLKHLKATKKPHLLIGICGCMMQQAHVIAEIQAKHRHVDIIFGTHNLSFFPSLLETRLDTGKMVIDIWEKHEGIDEITESLPTIREYPFKASVNITYGCDNFCTYCVVPYVRGRERSREAAEIIREIKALVRDGVMEVVLLGQNVNSYGKGLNTPISFAELLEEVADIPDLKRIRFMTSHPKDLSDQLMEVMGRHENICSSIHLPLQSGSSRLLAAMNRKYTKEDYLLLVEKLRKKMPGIPISTDIIVGFPGETEADFLETLDVLEQVRFSMAFTFYYSKRVGTVAANMAEQVPTDVARERFERLMEAVDTIIRADNEQKIGQEMDVFIESQNIQDESLITGRSSGGDLVHVKGNKADIGNILQVKITDCQTYYLMGEMVS